MVHPMTAMPVLVVALAIMMHPAMRMVFRHGRLHALPGIRSHRRLLPAQFLRPTLDLGRSRRVCTLTDRALRYLRKRGNRTKQQWKYGQLDLLHFHDAPLLTNDGLLSDNSTIWFHHPHTDNAFRHLVAVWHNAASLQEAWPSG